MDQELCPKMEKTLNLLGKKWVGLILYALIDGPKKFGEIEKYIPNISARVLTERLKELEKINIIEKHIYNEFHIRIEYELTKKGVDLNDSFETIYKWAQKWN
ncbi:MAG: transcriptional regulator [Tenericutes bacterium HGW-Tenericutes-3]|nr:MAG: transcriptional regulator [Tenericutes bacterium HGW-Tenericutes-3]